MTDRRSDARIRLPDNAPDVRATVRPGRRVALVDLSRRGALLESGQPMRPGARVHLQLAVGARVFTVAGQVLRCNVWALHADAGITYRGAVRFEAGGEAVREAVALFVVEKPPERMLIEAGGE